MITPRLIAKVMVDFKKLYQDINAYELEAKANKILNIATTLGVVYTIA
jgi:hypothetical protein